MAKGTASIKPAGLGNPHLFGWKIWGAARGAWSREKDADRKATMTQEKTIWRLEGRTSQDVERKRPSEGHHQGLARKRKGSG